MEERQEIEQAIAQLEAQREIFGAAAADAALDGLRRRLAELEGAIGDELPEPDRPQVAGERRLVTVLFCDVVGSTALAEKMDPEAWTTLMNEAFEHLTAPVDEYDGNVARLMGDAILAFFGAPTAHEDDPQRAILAGLKMLENVRPLRERLRRQQELDFNIRVGINTGLAVVGEVGTALHGEYSAMGDAVNVAARMEQTAAPGAVQIGHDTYTLVAPLFEFEELGGIPVKGKSEPVLAYRVLGARALPGSLRGLAGHGISAPLIGREKEFNEATGAFARLQEGEGGILTVLGEAGIGKSRLMAELRRSSALNNSQLTWLEGHTQAYGRSISYWPFQEILGTYAGITEEDDEAEAWHKLEASIRGLLPNKTTEILPYLASLLALEVSDEYAERVKYLDGEALGRQVYRASRRFFQRLAEQAPLVLLFEDLHWMDASSAGLIEHLLPLVDRVPLLICGLSRPDPKTAAVRLRQLAEEQYGSRFTLIELAPLSATDSGRLVHNLLEIDGLPKHVRQVMIDKSDGNPFYLEEIVRNLIDNGALVQEASTGRWQATKRIEKVTVPDTIHGLLIARIDRLDNDLKGVLRLAAVIGRTFLYRLLNAILEDDRDLDGQLDRLQSAELIREKQLLPELEYIFKHALAQEAAYDSILLQERREFHGRVGAAIETLMTGRLDEFYGLLAYHYSAAEQWEQAQDYLFKAGDQAGSMAADAEALAHYRLAMEAYAKVRGDDWEPLDRAQLERKIGEALFRMGEHKRARPFLERSLALLGAEVPSSQVGTRLAIGRALLTQMAHRLLPRIFVRPMRGSLDPVAEELFLATMALGWVEALADVERFFMLMVRGLNISERRGYPYGSATLAANMSLAASFIGWLGLAGRYLRQSALYAGQIVPYRQVPQLELGLAGYFNLLADLDKMMEHSRRGMEIAQDVGDLRAWGMGAIQLGWGHWGRGEYDEAAEVCQEMLRSAEDSSDRQLTAWGLLAYGCVQRRRGLLKEAVASHDRAVEIAQDLPDYPTQVGGGGWLGRDYLALGEVEQAMEVMEANQKIFADRGGNLPGYAVLANGLSEAYLMMAEESEGQTRQAWLKRAAVTSRQALKEARRFRFTLAEALMFRGRYEWLSGKLEAAQKSWARALTRAEESGMRYEQGMIRLEIGRRTNDRDQLLKAETILEEIGAEFDLAAVREALKAV